MIFYFQLRLFLIIILFFETQEETEISQITPSVREGGEKPVGVEKKKVRSLQSVIMENKSMKRTRYVTKMETKKLKVLVIVFLSF